MDRRIFMAGAAGIASSFAAPGAAAENLPTLTWRMASSYPKSLDVLNGSAEHIAKRVSELTEGKFTIRVFPAGEIVPAFQVLDAVQAGTVETGNTALYFFYGKDPTFTFDTGIPFGMNARQQTAWYTQGGGRELMAEFLNGYGVVSFACGNTGTQMGGWFRREVKSLDDLNGLKMRVGGIAGRILQKLGVVSQQIPPGDIYPALEKGTIDAAEFVGPHDDEKLGFERVAPYYYTPGWWEVGSQQAMLIGKKHWDALPVAYKAALTAACYEAHVLTQAKYDVLNPQALARMLKRGVKLRAFPKQVMDASLKACNEILNGEAEKNPQFRKIHDHYKRFQAQQNQWASVTEARMQVYQITSAPPQR